MLLHPTRLLRRKNVEFGMAVIAALRTAGCHATLLVTGAEDSHHAASRAYAAGLRDERARLRGLEGLLATRYEDLELVGYQSHGKIAAAVAI